MKPWLLFGLVMLVIAAGCAPGGGDNADQAANDALAALNSALDWDRSPDAVIVRMDTTGTSGSAANDLNVIPYCTIYGDGHIIWLDPHADPELVLEDRLDDAVVRDFLEYLIGLGFYSWGEETGLVPPTTEEPDEGPIIQRISVTLYGETRILNAYSNWPAESFNRILDRCRNLSDTPAVYLPAGAWVSAIPVEPRSDLPSMPWRAFAEAYPDVNLAAMTLDAPLWATGDVLNTFWEITRSGRLQVTDGSAAYRIVVQVPGLQPFAPPAPAAEPES